MSSRSEPPDNPEDRSIWRPMEMKMDDNRAGKYAPNLHKKNDEIKDRTFGKNMSSVKYAIWEGTQHPLDTSPTAPRIDDMIMKGN